MKQVTNIISMEEVKNKKEWNKRKEETDERMNKKDRKSRTLLTLSSY